MDKELSDMVRYYIEKYRSDILAATWSDKWTRIVPPTVDELIQGMSQDELNWYIDKAKKSLADS